jgi:ATP-binding cassette subfamily B protein
MLNKFPHYIQIDSQDCGPTCLKIISKYYNKSLNIQVIRILSETTREGSKLINISDAAEKIGFRTLGIKISNNKILEAPLPCILHWNKNHYVVLYKIKKGIYYISDPAIGLINYNQEEFLKFWIGNNTNETTEEGIALLLEPKPQFYSRDSIDSEEDKHNFSSPLWGLGAYLFPYKSFIVQLAIGLFAGSLLQLIFPFLTQSVVDVGIQNQNIHFIYLILFAQLFLFVGKTGLELIIIFIFIKIY